MTTDDQTPPSCCRTAAGVPAIAADGRADLLAPAAGASREDLLTAADMTTCPVMAGSPVDKRKAEDAGLFRDFEGRRYHFCCAGCGPAFDADPQRYAANAT